MGGVVETIPPEVRAKAKMKTHNGEVYSDFDVKLEVSANRVEEDSRKEGGKYKPTMKKVNVGLINGGEPEMQFFDV